MSWTAAQLAKKAILPRAWKDMLEAGAFKRNPPSEEVKNEAIKRLKAGGQYVAARRINQIPLDHGARNATST
jgi:hypothetical protein